MANRTPQLDLAFAAPRKGKRRGRPRARNGNVEHRKRYAFDRRMPVHVTIRMAAHVWNLRSRRSLSVLTTALYKGSNRFGLKIVQASVQGNHCHLLIEADRTASLTRGMKGLGVRIAKGLNRLMGRKGQVLGDRYHGHILKTPTEVRNAIHYIWNNHRHHMEPLGARFSATWEDPFTVTVRPPRTWLVRPRRPCPEPPAPAWSPGPLRTAHPPPSRAVR